MDTSNLTGKKNKGNDETDEQFVSEEQNKDLEALKKELQQKDKNVNSKDEEIKRLRANLSELQKVSKANRGDIRGSVNRQGDPKKICIGLGDDGVRIWKRADKLTDEDIEKRKVYIESIQQQNAKKY